jgi:hypothetical protein
MDDENRYAITELRGESVRILSFGYLVHDHLMNDGAVAWFRNKEDVEDWLECQWEKGCRSDVG